MAKKHHFFTSLRKTEQNIFVPFGLATGVFEELPLTESGVESVNLKILPKGTFVVALFGLEAEAVCGNCGLLGMNSTINQACMSIAPNDGSLMSEYIFYYYKVNGKRFCKRYAQGTKQQNLNIEILSKFEILVPPVEVQKKICDFLGSLEREMQILVNKSNCLRRLKRAFMRQMFI